MKHAVIPACSGHKSRWCQIRTEKRVLSCRNLFVRDKADLRFAVQAFRTDSERRDLISSQIQDSAQILIVERETYQALSYNALWRICGLSAVRVNSTPWLFLVLFGNRLVQKHVPSGQGQVGHFRIEFFLTPRKGRAMLPMRRTGYSDQQVDLKVAVQPA